MLKKDIKRLKAYPLIYMALSVFPSVHRLVFELYEKFYAMKRKGGKKEGRKCAISRGRTCEKKRGKKGKGVEGK